MDNQTIQLARDERPFAIYVHGLASGASGGSGGALPERFSQFCWIIDDFGEDLQANIKKINQMVEQYHPQLLVGTSMGGLEVIYATAPEAIKIVCNPALSVADCVRNNIGLGRHNYFCTRKDGIKTFVLTEEMCCDWERYIATHTPTIGSAGYAIFSEHDELLGEEATFAAKEYLEQCGFNTIVDPVGVHRMQQSTYDIIAERIVGNMHFTK